MKPFLWVALPLYLLDQLTKWAILKFLEEPIEVIPGFFNLVFVMNTGAAFGMLKGQNFFFIIVSLAALMAITWMFYSNAMNDPWSKWGGVLLIPGILGNLTDRLIHKFVVDFLDFHIGEHHWPAFNVADSCICVAVGLFLIGAWQESKTPDKRKEA